MLDKVQLKHHAIQQTLDWIHSFVIHLNLCPFAKREMERNTVRVEASLAQSIEQARADFLQELEGLHHDPSIATTLLLFPLFLNDFFDFLDFVDWAHENLEKCGYEGVYQLATFHPDYCFAEEDSKDVSNYTNRSPYPMIHLLREEQLEEAISFYGDTEQIPIHNIKNLRALGLEKVLTLLKNRP